MSPQTNPCSTSSTTEEKVLEKSTPDGWKQKDPLGSRNIPSILGPYVFVFSGPEIPVSG